MANTVRGHIELPSGSFRVHVYAGTDPVTGRPRRLRETCPDEAAAAATLGRLLNEADGGGFPNRAATLGQALDKYLEVTDLELSTKEAHQGYIRRRPGAVISAPPEAAPARLARCAAGGVRREMAAGTSGRRARGACRCWRDERAARQGR